MVVQVEGGRGRRRRRRMKFRVVEERKEPETQTDLSSILEQPPTTTEEETKVFEVTTQNVNRGTLERQIIWEGGWTEPVQPWHHPSFPSQPSLASFFTNLASKFGKREQPAPKEMEEKEQKDFVKEVKRWREGEEQREDLRRREKVLGREQERVEVQVGREGEEVVRYGQSLYSRIMEYTR